MIIINFESCSFLKQKASHLETTLGSSDLTSFEISVRNCDPSDSQSDPYTLTQKLRTLQLIENDSRDVVIIGVMQPESLDSERQNARESG